MNLSSFVRGWLHPCQEFSLALSRIHSSSDCCVLLLAAHADRESKDGLCAIYNVITHQRTAPRRLKCAARPCQRWCQHYSPVDNMLRSCSLCMIETSSEAGLSLPRQDLLGKQAAGITRFLARAEAEFPVYFQHCVFILGDWGDCVSLEARPLPPLECEMLRLGDAGLLLFVPPVCCDPELKVSAAFRGQEHTI